MPKILRRTYFALLCALPAVLFFSYHPIISLGANSSMNFELSFPLIWLVFFDLVAFIVLLIWWQKGNNDHKRSFAIFFGEHKDLAQRPGACSRKIIAKLLIYISFPLYVTISVFWSPNPLRAFLTASIIWLLAFAILAILRLSPLLEPPSRFKIRLLGTFFISTAVICLFCFIQSLLDSCGLSRETTLLCAGCTYRSFGFPHPNGFAIEPQFMGNLLLAPTLLALYLLCKPDKPQDLSTPFSSERPTSIKPEQISKTEHPEPEQPRSASVAELVQATEPTPADGFAEPEQPSSTFPHLRKTPTKVALVVCAILFSTTLFFTFSRGAIYSYALGLLILIIFALRRHTFRSALIIIPVVTFLLSLGLQGTFAQLGPTSETFTSAVTKSIHQLSLGLIDLRNTTTNESSGTASKGANDVAEPVPNVAPSGEHSKRLTAPAEAVPEPTFNGYVADSTNIRLSLSSTALATWTQSPSTIIFGVGLGGAGIAMHHFDPIANPSPKEIVQNQPVSLLLETGLLGVILLLAALYFAFHPGSPQDPKTSPFWSHPALPLLCALIVAYLISMQFFAGLPNALHIYLLPPLLYYLFLPNHQSLNPQILLNRTKNAKIAQNFTTPLPNSQNKHK